MITKNTIIKEVVDKHPEAIKVFTKHGLHCVGCGGALFESIEQGAQVHGIDIDKLMVDLTALEKKN